MEYLQPDFYHFSQLSIQFAKSINKLVKVKKNNFSHILDLCAGCGVIGIELASYQCISKIDFCEVNPKFEKYIKRNLTSNGLHVSNSSILIQDFNLLTSNHQYDLVVCNPPFFWEKSSRLKTTQDSKFCHSFVDKNFIDNLILKCQQLINKNGEYYFLMNTTHGDNRNQLDQLILKYSLTEYELQKNVSFFQGKSICDFVNKERP